MVTPTTNSNTQSGPSKKLQTIFIFVTVLFLNIELYRVLKSHKASAVVRTKMKVSEYKKAYAASHDLLTPDASTNPSSEVAAATKKELAPRSMPASAAQPEPQSVSKSSTNAISPADHDWQMPLATIDKNNEAVVPLSPLKTFVRHSDSRMYAYLFSQDYEIKIDLLYDQEPMAVSAFLKTTLVCNRSAKSNSSVSLKIENVAKLQERFSALPYSIKGQDVENTFKVFRSKSDLMITTDPEKTISSPYQFIGTVIGVSELRKVQNRVGVPLVTEIRITTRQKPDQPSNINFNRALKVLRHCPSGTEESSDD